MESVQAPWRCSDEQSAPRPTGRLLDRLPPEPRQHLLLIGSEGRGVFGAACFQSIFEAHISLFEYLAAAAATAVMTGRLLAEVGITRKDGTPLPPELADVVHLLSPQLKGANRRADDATHPSLR